MGRSDPRGPGVDDPGSPLARERALDRDDGLTTLRRSAAQGAKWSLVATVGSQLGRLLFTFVLARLLGPDSFGVVAAATIYITFTMLLLEQGFAAALIRKHDLDRRDTGSVACLNLATSLVLGGATLVLAPTVAAFFDIPELTAVLRVLTISVLIKGFAIVPAAMQRRNLRFRQQAVLQVGGMLVGGVAGVASAFAGADYWALVIQTVLAELFVLVGLVVKEGLPGVRASWDRVKELWSFSVTIMASQLVSFAGSNGDNLIIGRALDARQLAFYALSYRLLTMPIQMIGSVANGVALPIFSRLQHDPERMRSWLLTATRSVALGAYPILTLLVVGAPAGIPFLFGDQWEPAVVPLQLLALGGFIRVVSMLVVPMATALARNDLVLKWSTFTVAIALAGFAIGVRWGIVGVAGAVLVVQLVVLPPNVAHVGRLVDLRLGAYLRALVAPATGSALLAGSWLSLHALADGAGLPELVALSLASAIALAVYVAAIRFLWPGTYRATREIVGLMGREQP